jgi:hypothetical protein
VDKLYALERARDRMRVEFYKEERAGKMNYIIRETGHGSQDSVTTDPDAIAFFRQRLIDDGYMEVPFF